jgi:hypothetical protein
MLQLLVDDARVFAHQISAAGAGRGRQPHCCASAAPWPIDSVLRRRSMSDVSRLPRPYLPQLNQALAASL